MQRLVLPSLGRSGDLFDIFNSILIVCKNYVQHVTYAAVDTIDQASLEPCSNTTAGGIARTVAENSAGIVQYKETRLICGHGAPECSMFSGTCRAVICNPENLVIYCKDGQGDV